MSGLPALEDDYLPEDDAAETALERLLGLSEMFPEPVRNTVGTTVRVTGKAAKKAYELSRSITWIVFASSTLMFAPVLFEMERHQMEEMQKQQQRQMLLGPNAAYSR
ncbi:unnamed protein product [Allacma fusca]|uniref:Mitochondrial import receptor subunit TOM22 homolog n=1 Tax=Allacma fusca TaxID=39272 RepID=A0A8J2LA52_9HEXA|nr:unnamed protein product [Allacma fusca]